MNFTTAIKSLYGFGVALLFVGIGVSRSCAQDLYVTNQGLDSIFRFPSGSTYISQSVTVLGGGSFSYPAALAFDPTGNLFSANYNNSSNPIEMFKKGNLLSNGVALTSPTASNDFLSVASDTHGDLFAGEVSGEIIRFGVTNGSIATTGTVFDSGLGTVSALAFDDNGNLYAVDRGNQLVEFPGLSPSPQFIANMSARNGGNAVFGLAFDHSGDLFVANGDQTITEFTSNGQNGGISSNPTVFATGIAPTYGPYGLVFDSSGSLYATTRTNNTVIKFAFSNTTGLSPTSTVYIGSSSGMSLPAAIAIDPVTELSSKITLATWLLMLTVLILRKRMHMY